LTVALLRYTAITSVDGYLEDRTGSFDWAEPDEEVHAFVNDRERDVGTYLYGRRMWETMRWWGTDEATTDQPQVVLDYAAVWRAADKIVVSSSLEAVDEPRARIERSFDPEAVRALKENADHDLSVGGAALGASAIAAGLVDEIGLFLVPVSVGGGKPALPDARLRLDLLEERRFTGGTVFLRYALR
jgi:dihydrofolate reductase